ncbi:ATP-binding protein [Pseudoduganella sp. GCM10020061]|uniref:ATP-binding protein n=1 Tax=Pseudoduganella sp. GCM10020061 TaxID=3317345 RepID=UPI00363BC5A7
MMDLILQVQYPAVVLWGADHSYWYNDAYIYLLGGRHPAALGQPFRETWPELWPETGPIIENAMAGIPAYFENVPFTTSPDGVPEQRYFTLSFSPVRDRSGRVLGMFNAGFETTTRVADERRVTFELALADRFRTLSTPDDIVTAASEMLGRQLGVSRVLYAEVDDANGRFIIRRGWNAPGVASLAGETRILNDFGPGIIDLLRRDEAMVVHDIEQHPLTAPVAHNYAHIGVRANLAVPLVRAGRLETVLTVHSAEPRTWHASDVALVRDVAERTWLAVDAARAQSALQESEARLLAIFESLPVGVGVADQAGDIVLGNQEMLRYFPTRKLPAMDSACMSRWHAVYPDGRPVEPNDSPAMRALRGERTVPGMEALYTRADGVDVWTQVAAVPILDGDGAVSGCVVVITNVDALKRTEAALVSSDEKYRALFNEMESGFCILEVLFDAAGVVSDCRYLETNPVFQRQTGMSDVVGKTVRALLPDIPPEWFDVYGRVVRTGRSEQFERYTPPLGKWFDVNVFLIGEPGENKVAVIFKDTTIRKKDEENTRRLAEDLDRESRRKSEFLAVLAHELRNPLAPIRTGLEIIRMRADSPATVLHIHDMIARQTNHMIHLIDDLLDIARITTGKIELKKAVIDLNDSVANAVETSLPAVEAARHELHLRVYDEPLHVEADAVRVGQVISNLLTNAAKYTPKGGKISVVIGKEGSDAVVTVTDNGIGIPKEALDNVFNMFSQVERSLGQSQGGLGIGLALVRQLVTLHGGSVIAASEGEGKGCTFTVRLPLGTASLRESPGPMDVAARSAVGTHRILIVDDNVDAAYSLAALLKLNGHEILVAHAGGEAIVAASTFRPGVAFLDIGLPDISGYELARCLRDLPGMQSMTIAALTGWGSEADRARSEKAGFDAHLTKPVSSPALEAVLLKASPPTK